MSEDRVRPGEGRIADIQPNYRAKRPAWPQIHAISADYEMYPLIEKYLNNADTFLWTNLKPDEQKHQRKIKEIVGIENIKVLLVQHRTAYYR